MDNRIIKLLDEDSKDDIHLFSQIFDGDCTLADDFKRNVLMLALRNEHTDTFKFVVEKFADNIYLPAMDIYDQNILHYLAMNSDSDLVDFLYSNMCKVHNNDSTKAADKLFADLVWTRNHSGWYPDQVCLQYGHYEMQRYLRQLRTNEYSLNIKYGLKNSDFQFFGENDRKFMFCDGRTTEDGSVDRTYRPSYFDGNGGGSYDDDDDYDRGNIYRRSYSSNSNNSYGRDSDRYNNGRYNGRYNDRQWRRRQSDDNYSSPPNRYNSTPAGNRMDNRRVGYSYANNIIHDSGHEQKMNGSGNGIRVQGNAPKEQKNQMVSNLGGGNGGSGRKVNAIDLISDDEDLPPTRSRAASTTANDDRVLCLIVFFNYLVCALHSYISVIVLCIHIYISLIAYYHR